LILVFGKKTRVLSVDHSSLLFVAARMFEREIYPLSSTLPARISERALRIFHNHFTSTTFVFLGDVFTDSTHSPRYTELSLFSRREKPAIESHTIDNDSDICFYFEIVHFIVLFISVILTLTFFILTLKQRRKFDKTSISSVSFRNNIDNAELKVH